jgi:hypothetical protein
MGGVRLVAGEALRILPGGGSGCFRTKINHARQRSAARLYVRAAWAVTCLALKPAVAEWPARIIRLRMSGMEHAGDPGIVMAAEAGVCSVRTVWGIGKRRTGGWRSGRRRRHYWRIGRERA